MLLPRLRSVKEVPERQRDHKAERGQQQVPATADDGDGSGEDDREENQGRGQDRQECTGQPRAHGSSLLQLGFGPNRSALTTSGVALVECVVGHCVPALPHRGRCPPLAGEAIFPCSATVASAMGPRKDIGSDKINCLRNKSPFPGRKSAEENLPQYPGKVPAQPVGRHRGERFGARDIATEGHSDHLRPHQRHARVQVVVRQGGFTG